MSIILLKIRAKEVVLEVLNLLPFGGVAKTAFDFLLKSIEGI